jgi:hypothetical protein
MQMTNIIEKLFGVDGVIRVNIVKEKALEETAAETWMFHSVMQVVLRIK